MSWTPNSGTEANDSSKLQIKHLCQRGAFTDMRKFLSVHFGFIGREIFSLFFAKKVFSKNIIPLVCKGLLLQNCCLNILESKRIKNYCF